MQAHCPKSGIIESEYEPMKCPNTNVFNFLYPYYQKYNNLKAVICPKSNNSYTYGQVLEASLRWANELKKNFVRGTPPTVACICPNKAEYFIVTFGAFAVGAPLCLIRHDLKPDLMLHFVQEAKVSILVIDSSVYEHYLHVINSLKGMLTREEFKHSLKDKVKIYIRNEDKTLHKGEDLFSIFSKGDCLDIEFAKQVDPESTAVIALSSGTTGNPKGIVISQRSYVNSSALYTHEAFFPLQKASDTFQEIIISNMPFAHSYGMQYCFISAATAGCCTVAYELDDSANYLSYLQRYQPTHLFLGPFLIEKLMKQDIPVNAFDSVKIIANAGSPYNPNSIKKLKEAVGGKFEHQEQYGATEIGAAVAAPLHGYCSGATGKILPGYKAYLADINTGKPILTPHTIGELCIQSPGFMKEYLDNPKATKEVTDEANFFRTGDVTYFDHEYYFYITERIKDVMIVSGKKVYPSSIEKILMEHESVLDAGVVEIRDEETEDDSPKALVILNHQVKEEELINYVEERAPPEMRLRGGVTFVDSLPRNHMGKLDRKLLRLMNWKKISNFNL